MKELKFEVPFLSLAMACCLGAFLIGSQQVNTVNNSIIITEYDLLLEKAILNPSPENMTAYLAAQKALIETATTMAKVDSQHK